VVCFTSLKYDSVTTLEQFFSHEGCRVLADTIAKVTGVLNVNEEEVTIYNVAVGAARFIKHYLGIRKRGPNVTLVPVTAAGANDQFLEVAQSHLAHHYHTCCCVWHPQVVSSVAS